MADEGKEEPNVFPGNWDVVSQTLPGPEVEVKRGDEIVATPL